MTLKEALDILGLKEDCTEEELKIAYRRLMKDNHPDKCGNNKVKEKFTKKINDARDIVMTHIKPKNNINLSNDNPNLNTLKTKYEKEISLELKYILKISKNPDIINLLYTDRFRALIYNDFNMKLRNINDVEHLKQEYNNYRKKYIKLLYLYNGFLASRLGVNEVDLANHTGIPFHKDITLEFYRDRVLEIVNYNLNIELDKYKNIEDYNVLEYLLIAIRETHARTCLWGQKSLSTTKKEFNKHINITINKYYQRKKILNELIEFNYDKDIIDKLQSNILNEKIFYDIYNNVKKPTIKDKIGKKLARIFEK